MAARLGLPGGMTKRSERLLEKYFFNGSNEPSTPARERERTIDCSAQRLYETRRPSAPRFRVVLCVRIAFKSSGVLPALEAGTPMDPVAIYQQQLPQNQKDQRNTGSVSLNGTATTKPNRNPKSPHNEMPILSPKCGNDFIHLSGSRFAHTPRMHMRPDVFAGTHVHAGSVCKPPPKNTLLPAPPPPPSVLPARPLHNSPPPSVLPARVRKRILSPTAHPHLLRQSCSV